MSRDEFLQEFYAFLERALACAEKARREGLLALEAALDREKVERRDIFEYGLQFAVDGFDPQIIDSILSNILNQEKDEFKKLLKKIERDAVISIQSGMSAKVLALTLNSYTDIPLNDPAFKTIINNY